MSGRLARARHGLGRRLEPVRWRLLRLVPRPVIYWAVMQAGVEHCGGPNHPTEVVPEVPFVTVLERCGRRRRRAVSAR